jgi:hypothetical protein
MSEQGGLRRPAKPAPVSGPGALSRRTDGGPTQGARYMRGGSYGEGQEMMGLQQAAPMAAQPKTRASAAPRNVAPVPIASLSALTERPDEPLTTGNSMGAGPGPEILSTPQPKRLSEVFAQIAANDLTNEANLIYQYLQKRGF